MVSLLAQTLGSTVSKVQCHRAVNYILEKKRGNPSTRRNEGLGFEPALRT